MKARKPYQDKTGAPEESWGLSDDVIGSRKSTRSYTKLVQATRIAIALKEGTEAGNVGDLITTLRDAVRSLPVAPHHCIKVAGRPIKVIASNIRGFDFPWETTELLKEGQGQEGDIVLAEVRTNEGSTIRIENIHGRDERVYKGDHVLVVLGNRHSGTSEYGGIPDEGWDIQQCSEVSLLCHGGIVGKMESIPPRMGSSATQLLIKGLLTYDGKTLNTKDLFPEWDETLEPSAPIIAFCGTGAEIGKTTTASAIIRSLKGKGLKVAATKLAGTGRYRDLLDLRDAGAEVFLDFPDVGLPSTYTNSERYIQAIITLLNRLNEQDPNVIIAEFGGDIIEANIPTFFEHSELNRLVRAVVHSSGDILGMTGSMTHYGKWMLNDRSIYLTYPIGRNHAGSKNRIKAELDLPVFNPMNPEEVDKVVRTLSSQLSLIDLANSTESQ